MGVWGFDSASFCASSAEARPGPACLPRPHTTPPPCPCLPAAPITAANLVANVQAGLYNGAPLSVSGNAVLAGTQAAAAANDVGEGVSLAATEVSTAAVDCAPELDGGAGRSGSAGASAQGQRQRGARLAPAALPLEILAQGEFEPLYRSTLDVRSGELPVLPLSIYGAGVDCW